MIDFFENIDSYHQGKLRAEDRRNFEIQMAREPELLAAVKNHDIALAVLDLITEEAVRDQISDLELMSMTTGPEKRSILSAVLFVVICTIALIILLFYFSDSDNHRERINADQLFALHYIPYHDSRTRGTSAYIQIDSSRILVDQGHQMMDTGLLADAQSKFLKVLETQPNAGTEKAEWYLLLCYLGAAETVKTDSLLAKILEDNNHLYYPNAQALNKDMENFKVN